MCKVSIVLPTYNGEKYLRQAIESCLKQTYKNIELIIVNDGSTDKTGNIIKSYHDKRIRYIVHPENRGLPEALNTGFSVAKGNYLTWISDDNYYTNNAIERMLNFLKRNRIEFVYSDFYRFNNDNTQVVKLQNIVKLENYNGIGACFLYTKKVKEVIGMYDPETLLAEDYDYWIRVSKKFKIYHYDVPLLYYREHGSSLSLQFYKRYEVQIVAVLVRLKNNIINVKQATKQFIDILSRKKASKVVVVRIIFFPEFIVLKQILKFVYRIRISKKVRVKLEDFKMKRISFNEAKEFLKNIAR